VVLFSAYGPVLNQQKLKDFAQLPHLILVCGRYEGVDQRFIDQLVDEECSLGDFVLMGGEVAAEALLEGVSRMLPGVVGNPESVATDSFYNEGQMAFPQFTQPRAFRGQSVPDVLLEGDHKKIAAWRKHHMKRR
jgi:tRNA (guanine37-N1)-methyltransferase